MSKALLKIFYGVAFSILILPCSLFAQYGSIGATDARSMGLGKTYTAYSTGVYSIGINPANLILEDDVFIQFAAPLPLPTVSAQGGISALSLDEFNYFFGGINGESRVLTDSEKKSLNSSFENGGYVSGGTSLQLLSFSIIPGKKIGAFGFAITDYSGGKAIIPAAIIDLALNGNPVDKVFDLSEAEVHSWWIRNYSLTYAQKFEDISTGMLEYITGGFSFKYVQGFAYAGTEQVNSFITTSDKHEISGGTDYLAFTSFSDNFGVDYEFDSLDSKSNFDLFPAPAGSGFGVDFGLTFSLKDFATLSIAVTDLGSITWRNNAAKFYSDGSLFLDDLTDDSRIDSLLDKMSATAEPVKEFNTGLASALRLGAAFEISRFEDDRFPGYLLIAADYNQGFNNLPGNSTKPRISFGLEWQIIEFLPMIRTGFEYNEVEGVNWALGLGFVTSFFEIHLATSSFQTTFAPGTSSIISAAVSSRWKIE
jgi:hypothetical protein